LRNASRGDSIPYFVALPLEARISAVPLASNPEDIPIFNSDEGSECEDVPIPTSSPPTSFARRILRAGARTLRSIGGFLTPPLWASIMSLVVVLCQPLQHFIIGYLRPVRGTIAQAGDCSVPLTLIVLGAYFHRPPSPDEAEPLGRRRITLTNRLRKIFDRDSLEGLVHRESYAPWNEKQGEGRTIFVTILARMFVVPMLFLPLVVIGALRGSPSVFKDPVFILSQVLLIASPPAVTLAQITKATSEGLERLISRTIFWSYCLVAPPLLVLYALIAMLITRL